MAKTFKGRPALAGSVDGKAAVSHVGFNTAATFIEVITKGSNSGVCKDHDNKDLFARTSRVRSCVCRRPSDRAARPACS